MTGQQVTMLCRYQYDPIDRLASCTPLNQQSIQRFYRNDRLGTEIQGATQYSFFEHGTQVLAQQRREAGKVECALQATDLQGSVLHAVAVGQHQQMVYSVYGHRSPESSLISLLGFNGERRDSVTGLYVLGNGYRPFSTELMRFICPDRLSPHGAGGMNAYTYCGGDPVNRIDPKGSSFLAYLGKYLPRASGLSADAISWQAGSIKSVLKEFNLSTGKVVKAGASSNNIQRPAGAAFSGMNTLDSLDLASPGRLLVDSGQSNRDIAKLGSLADLQEGAIRNLEVAQTQMKKLETLVESRNIDPAGIPSHPVYENYIDAQTRLAQTTADYVNGMKLHFLKYPSQRKNAVQNARWAIRRSSI